MTLALAAIAIVVPPLLTLRGKTLASWFGAASSLSLFAWLLAMQQPPVPPRLGWCAFAVLQAAAFALFLAKGTNVAWSATRAAVAAAAVYAAVLPAMLVTPPDGDEPYYLVVTESLARDGDLDLANQYAGMARSAIGRPDLAPFPGDPTGPGGEKYSRHEPFLSLLMVPGYSVAGLPGALATIALFGVLLVRSTFRWMDEEGVSAAAARMVFPFFALGPPVLFFATRAWPEVPAAFFLVEAIRGMRAGRGRRWIPAVAGLVLLKLRFVLAALGLLAAFAFARRSETDGKRSLLRWSAVAVVVAIPLAVMWFVSGDATSVHSWRELFPGRPAVALRGAAGLLADGMSGIAFQAPFFLLGFVPLLRWREAPRGYRIGAAGAALYLLYLVPRNEWFGGWAPPLRYVAFLFPLLALGAAWALDRGRSEGKSTVPAAFLCITGLWTAGLIVHGLAWPWRLFHIFNGENAVGEWLSASYSSDFSRLFPSMIRPNAAAIPWLLSIALLIAWLGCRAPRLPRRGGIAIAVTALLLGAGFVQGRKPGARVEFEDAHVSHSGGELYPELYTMTRTAYRGGWVLESGESMSFLAQEGEWTLHFITGLGAMIEIEGSAYQVRPDPRYQTLRVPIRSSGRVTLRCLSGGINADRMDRDE